MNGKLQKILGWLLFLIGLTIIVGSLYFSYNIFLAKKLPPEIFKIEKENKVVVNVKNKNQFTSEELEEQMRMLVAEELKELIPKETLNTFLNLIAWSVFVGILIFGGSQIALLGIKMQK